MYYRLRTHKNIDEEIYTMVKSNNIKKMCELSDFYLDFLKKNSTPHPFKPVTKLSTEQIEKLKIFFKKQGKKL